MGTWSHLATLRRITQTSKRVKAPRRDEQVRLHRGLRFGDDPRRSSVEALASLSIPFVPVRSCDLAGTSRCFEIARIAPAPSQLALCRDPKVTTADAPSAALQRIEDVADQPDQLAFLAPLQIRTENKFSLIFRGLRRSCEPADNNLKHGRAKVKRVCRDPQFVPSIPCSSPARTALPTDLAPACPLL